MASVIDKNDNIPQWKRELIARLRNQNRKSEERFWLDHQPHKPVAELIVPSSENGYQKYADQRSDSSEEDLHYGPGIVNKLRNKYLSLALRESNSRPTILRKATSLENLLDDDGAVSDGDKGGGRLFRSRGGGVDVASHCTRYRSTARRQEMKRARSVEAISRRTGDEEIPPAAPINNRQSLHEEMLIENVPETPPEEDARRFKKMNSTENGVEEPKFNGRINRPKRIQPLLNEKEKPPSDVVKQAKMIFEKRPETRTKKPPQTGDVAAKVDSFNNIIVKAKVASSAASKKPPIKHTKPVLPDRHKSNTHTRPVTKPVVLGEEVAKPRSLDLKGPKRNKREVNLPSPIPDVSRVEHKNFDGSSSRTTSVSSLCETPDLILTSSPLPMLSSPTFRRNVTERFIKDEKDSAHPNVEASNRYVSPAHSPLKPSLLNFNQERPDSPGVRTISPIAQKNNVARPAVGSSVFNFLNAQVNQSHLPAVNCNVCDSKTPPSEPLKIEVNGYGGLSATEIEKNQKNDLRTAMEEKQGATKVFAKDDLDKLDKVTKRQTNGSCAGAVESAEVLNRTLLHNKKNRVRVEESNIAVFNFTARKEVPDYISNDTRRMPVKPALPKPGEGGIIIIQGATLIESFADDEEEILRSLEAPPSPCDVNFINDNVLIDGKSSLSQSSKRVKLKISFVETADIYEYPSEDSLLTESPSTPQLNSAQAQQLGHTVPMLSGSTLSNYTPKTTEEFQLGITRIAPQPPQSTSSKPDVAEVGDQSTDLIFEEVENPVLFSAGTNSDILF